MLHRMSSQPSIADKFSLVEELSFEPIGCYYKASLKTRETVLILLLNNDFSNIARKNIESLITKIKLPHDSLIEHGIIPVIDIMDCLEGVALIMPYFEGVTLAEFINNTKPLGIVAIKKLMKPVLVSLSGMHRAGKFHGFINFSTTWVAANNQVVILGDKVFQLIFNNLRYINTSLDNTRINSCINKDVALGYIKCTIYSDYYSVLMIIRSMLFGYIANNSNVSNHILEQRLSQDTKIYLTKTFCNKAYNNFISINEWIDKIKPARYINKVYMGSIVCTILLISCIITGFYYLDSNNNQQVFVENIIIPNGQAPRLNPIQNSGKQKLIQRFTNITDLELGNKNEANSKIDKTSENHKDLNKSITITEPKVINDKPVRKESTKSNDSDGNVELTSISKVLEQEEEIIQKYYKDIENKTQSKPKSETVQVSSTANNDRRYSDKIAFKAPKVTQVELADTKALVMANPISKEDFYTYCYLDSSCNIDWEVNKDSLAACLFERKCDPKLYAWLESPMEFTSANQVNLYLSWLNSHNDGKYDILPDIYWTLLAGNFNPEQNCQAIENNSKFKVYSQYPEWVKVDTKIALRGPVRPLADDSQCQVALDLEGSENYSGKMLVRLIKKA